MATPYPSQRLAHPVSLILAVCLCAFAARADEVADEGGPPPEASSQVRISLDRLGCDVWGGDGEGLPAIWDLVAELRVHNRGDDAVRIEAVSWQMVVGEATVRGRLEGEAFELAPGESRRLISSAYLPLPQLRILREGVRTAGARRVRTLTGELAFLRGGRRHIAPFSASGRWIGCMDADSGPSYRFDEGG